MPYSKSIELRSWESMKARCLNKNNQAYSRYGGRGITICKRWLDSFQNFLKDMGNKPTQEHTLDRINNDGNYEISNCRWATPLEQSWNSRKSTMLEYNGVHKSIRGWARYAGLPQATIMHRYRKGLTLPELLAPKHKRFNK